MNLLFDTNGLDGLEPLERSKVAAALARILMQTAGVRASRPARTVWTLTDPRNPGRPQEGVEIPAAARGT